MNRLSNSIAAGCLVVLITGGVTSAQNFVLQSSVIGSGAVDGSSTNFKALGTVGQSAIGNGNSANFKGSWGFWYTLGSSGGAAILANVDVFLEGPYNAGSMNVNLLSDLPTSQPFSGSPWNYSGTESVPSTDTSPPNGTPDFFDNHNTIVDWVYVQLRSGDPASPPMTIEGERAGFLKSDGTIVDIDGTSPLSFPGLSAGSYYVVVEHRNHLSAMSADAVASASDTVAYDFTTALAKAYTGGGTAMKDLSDGNFGLFAGDANGDGQTTVVDFSAWLTATTSGTVGYFGGDFNLDRNATVLDFSKWLANTTSGASSQVPSGSP